MQHILNVAFDFDDEKINKRIEDNAYDDIIKMFYSDMQKVICNTRYSGYTGYKKEIIPNDLSPLKAIIREEVRDMLLDNKNLIIREAADGLVEYIKRTKKFKEAVGEIIESEKE